MTVSHPADADFYDAHYYGHTDTPTANYRGYGEPGWSRPLARWLVANTAGPWLDAGCAFGHLVRDLNREAAPGGWACGVEWSAYAVEHTVAHPNIWQADVRDLARAFGEGLFRTVISMDLLEHFAPAETERVIAELGRVCSVDGVQVHLIGWPLPGREDGHYSDPSHVNHTPIGWYRRAFAAAGWRLDKERTRALNLHPGWRRTAWCGRWQVYRRAR